ncbi:MAG: type II secretion system GspH family protein [Gemmataceae bacterium]|nr:type II secretion system GspH family protein [Gemmataceae bacterium]
MIGTAKPRRGFTLVEILCVIILLSVLGGILVVLLNETLAVQETQAESHQRLVAQSTLADQFRADVARAEKAPRMWRNYKAGRETLILQNKNGGHVLYLWDKGRLERRAIEGEKELTQVVLAGDRQVGVEFIQDSAPRLVRLRLLTLSGQSPLPGQTLEIDSALGGDWR